MKQTAAEECVQVGLIMRTSVRKSLIWSSVGLVMLGAAVKNKEGGIISGGMTGAGLIAAIASRRAQLNARRDYCKAKGVSIVGAHDLGAPEITQVKTMKAFTVFGGVSDEQPSNPQLVQTK